MDFSEKEVRALARLARLDVKDSEIPSIASDLHTILEYVGQLQQVNTEQVEPMLHGSAVAAPLREDVVVPSLPVAEAVKNGPVVKDNMFVVPRR
ncbi:MAG: Asp-tRNA(Asn)/Glu-tRNA(Gln) amidotransferase subunit GatC, partial [Firmicutes bacterium]|nr:Asp-tRNA(Asn)/Glu-tRNA(Gln) amidotransferase subunit GatC [Bacillota bacterium]